MIDQILATGTNQSKLQKLKEKFPNIHTKVLNLMNIEKIEKFIEDSSQKIKWTRYFINNAGITLDNLSIRLTEENWKKVLDINLTSSFLMCKYSIKKM